MKLILQRTSSASVTVNGEVTGSIGRGLCVLVGIETRDTMDDVDYLAKKVLAIRLFDDDAAAAAGKPWSKSVKDLGLGLLLVSQFTLHARLKGNKPDFSHSMAPDSARDLFDAFVARVKALHTDEKLVQTGVFGAMMQVAITNDGPVTISLDSQEVNFPRKKQKKASAAAKTKKKGGNNNKKKPASTNATPPQPPAGEEKKAPPAPAPAPAAPSINDDMLVIPHSQVTRLLTFPVAMQAVKRALMQLERKEACMPLRFGFRMPKPENANFRILGHMPSFLRQKDASELCASKVVTVFPGNTGTPYHSHQGAVLLFDGRFGRLLATVDAGEVTAVRTAAASALATDLLARADATTLCLIGCGVQAGMHLRAMQIVRPGINKVQVWSRTAARAQAFVASSSSWCTERSIAITCCDSGEAAAKDADIICTVTAATEPVLESAWVKPGAHVNAVGACTPAMCELDAALVARCSLFTDSKESALAEPGEVVRAIKAGVVDAETLVKATIGELLVRRDAAAESDGDGGGDGDAGPIGRTSSEEVTVFESLGLAVEDLAAAQAVYDAVQLEQVQQRAVGKKKMSKKQKRAAAMLHHAVREGAGACVRSKFNSMHH